MMGTTVDESSFDNQLNYLNILHIRSGRSDNFKSL
jgi:hypothetical protein